MPSMIAGEEEHCAGEARDQHRDPMREMQQLHVQPAGQRHQGHQNGNELERRHGYRRASDSSGIIE